MAFDRLEKKIDCLIIQHMCNRKKDRERERERYGEYLESYLKRLRLGLKMDGSTLKIISGNCF